MHSEFEESEDNLLTLVLSNPIELNEPENLLAFKLTRVAFLPKTTSTLKLSQGDLLVEREHIIAANSSFNMCKKMNNYPLLYSYHRNISSQQLHH